MNQNNRHNRSIVHIWYSNTAAAASTNSEGIKANENAHSGEMKRNRTENYTMHKI